MDSKEDLDNTVTKDLAERLKKYTTQIDYSGMSPTDSITLSPSVSFSNISMGATGVTTFSSLSPNITISNGAAYSAVGSPWTSAPITNSGTIELRGDNADINVNGKSLMATLAGIEERLNMLTANKEMENEWDELKELGERYRELEKLCKEKSKMWNKLKSMPPPNIN